MLRKIISVMMAVTVLSLFAVVIPASADTVTTDLPETMADKTDNSYESYIASFTDIKAFEAEETVIVEQNIMNTAISVPFEIQNDGLYKIGFSYKAVGEGTSDLVFGFKLDGEYPFSEAEELELPRMWVLSDQKRVDGLGNEFSPEVLSFEDYAYEHLRNNC